MDNIMIESNSEPSTNLSLTEAITESLENCEEDANNQNGTNIGGKLKSDEIAATNENECKIFDELNNSETRQVSSA